MGLFSTEFNHSQSSRALGWNTNDPGAPDYGWNLSCGGLSARTFMHTGYSGTEVCIDPVSRMFTVLLTNRVYPNDPKVSIAAARREFNTAALGAFANWTAAMAACDSDDDGGDSGAWVLPTVIVVGAGGGAATLMWLVRHRTRRVAARIRAYRRRRTASNTAGGTGSGGNSFSANSEPGEVRVALLDHGNGPVETY